MKKYSLAVLLSVLVLGGCARNRFAFIDIAASEKALSALEAGFRAIPDSMAGCRRDYLLSQGTQVADILVFAGESGDPTLAPPPVPKGYNCQWVTADVVMDSLKIKGGRYYTDGGMNGGLLYLQDDRMSLPMLNRMAGLASSGAVITGVKPVTPLDSADNVVFKRTVEKVWMSGNVQPRRKLYSILKTVGIRPDMKTRVDGLKMEHRHLPNTEIYHLCNTGDFSGRAKLNLRTVGRVPMEWNPDTGEILPLGYRLKKRSTVVWINLVPNDDTFIVFASYSDRRSVKL